MYATLATYVSHALKKMMTVPCTLIISAKQHESLLAARRRATSQHVTRVDNVEGDSHTVTQADQGRWRCTGQERLGLGVGKHPQVGPDGSSSQERRAGTRSPSQCSRFACSSGSSSSTMSSCGSCSCKGNSKSDSSGSNDCNIHVNNCSCGTKHKGNRYTNCYSNNSGVSLSFKQPLPVQR